MEQNELHYNSLTKYIAFQIQRKETETRDDLRDATRFLIHAIGIATAGKEPSEDEKRDPAFWQAEYEKNAATPAAQMLLQKILPNPRFPRKFVTYVELGYVDRVYRDIYYTHYSSNHFDVPRNCVRLFFFTGEDLSPEENAAHAEERFVGVCVIQPNGIVGRSYFAPKYFLPQGYYMRTARFHVNFQGHELSLSAFPYMMQDRESTTCAEVTVLNLAEYFSRRYYEYPAILLSDVEAVEKQYSADRIFPSQGMNYQDVARVLARMGLSPRIISRQPPRTSAKKMRQLMYYYAESAIPFAVALRKNSSVSDLLHSVICIGHGPRREGWLKECTTDYLWSGEEIDSLEETVHDCWIADLADAYDDFVFMDDNCAPYSSIALSDSLEGQGTNDVTLELLCVPLYKRIVMEAQGAKEVFDTFLISKAGFQSTMTTLTKISASDLTPYLQLSKTQANPLITRIFLASSRSFLSYRIKSLSQLSDEGKLSQFVLDVYQNLRCPRFVWVCELYSQEGLQSGQALGEVVIDATSDPSQGFFGVLLIHYPHFITYRQPASQFGWLDANRQEIPLWAPFPQFAENLQPAVDLGLSH